MDLAHLDLLEPRHRSAKGTFEREAQMGASRRIDDVRDVTDSLIACARMHDMDR
ncbi:MAG TPA: hypothetical protein VMQ63_07600 [Stellaceae bacterium]|nr:hypothetical protein [Stellaceae bacterium]